MLSMGIGPTSATLDGSWRFINLDTSELSDHSGVEVAVEEDRDCFLG